MPWSLYDKDKFLEPLKFSNGKNQEDVVKEILNSIRNGKKVIFIKGMCGTGKSAIALNVAKELGKTSVVVPGKALQNQYKEDYENNKYLLKNNGERLKISVVTGRNNHKCRFLEEKNIPVFKEERNLRLNEIFAKKEPGEKGNKDTSADNPSLPCKIEIKDRNKKIIMEYVKDNKAINPRNIQSVKDVKRATIAPVCPYWSPVFPEKFELSGKNFENAKKRSYEGLKGMRYNFYQRREGCKFYEQFNSFIDADVIVFNSLKYKLESAMNRKPLTEAEIIDECDEFLDSFSSQRTINIDRLQNSLNMFYSENENFYKVAKEISELVKKIKSDERMNHAIYSGDIIPLKETPIYPLLKLFLENQEFLVDLDDESYLFEIAETARIFDEFFDETYTTFSKKDENMIIELVTTNLAKKFKEMMDKNKIIILMSGTLHSENILKNVFGIDNFEILDAETEQQGRIETLRTGLEFDCKYPIASREKYLKALNKCVEVSKKPTLIHINSFADLPGEKEIQDFGIKNLISREELRDIQEHDKKEERVRRFKKKEIDVLFSTKCNRGVDFPGEECRSIVFTKYPNPDVKSSFWKILNKTNPAYYWDFYKDKARRELLQRIYRGLRFKEDHVFLLSPDERVLRAFE
ncbi:MAG: helicase C-terminal domain-containing protein [Candidatus Nanoarchaeia archaeon]|nr:helicase C-terminal domain-containing protein [Candidatus Nanoarchaeia archaeon]